jgi:hypothetical protein
MSPRFARCVVAIGLPSFVLAALALWQARADALKAAPIKVTIYDADPQHLWNRLHATLWVRTGPDGNSYGVDRLDPLLWFETKHLLEGKSHEQAVAVLDEFLAKQGEALVKDPLKRAILQRDLWEVFDWTTGPGANTQDAYLLRASPSRRALQTRLARAIQRLALTAEEIDGLPDNYAAAVAPHAFAEKHNPDHPERPFLPPDLLQKDGPWVQVTVDNSSQAAATSHVHGFLGRSAFRVFLRFPEGRQATVDYFAKLHDFPRPWLVTRELRDKRDTLVLNPDLPQFPVGTQAALVRQMLLIDRTGRIAVTPVTESVQLRVFREIPKLANDGDRRRAGGAGQDFYEFTRSRALLFAGKMGGLRPVERNEKDFRTQFLVHTFDELELKEDAPIARRMGEPMKGCIGCHDRPGIHAFRTYTGGDYPRGQYYLPDLSENRDPDTEGRLAGIRKRQHYSWGLLQGLWRDGSEEGR